MKKILRLIKHGDIDDVIDRIEEAIDIISGELHKSADGLPPAVIDSLEDAMSKLNAAHNKMTTAYSDISDVVGEDFTVENVRNTPVKDFVIGFQAVLLVISQIVIIAQFWKRVPKMRDKIERYMQSMVEVEKDVSFYKDASFAVDGNFEQFAKQYNINEVLRDISDMEKLISDYQKYLRKNMNDFPEKVSNLRDMLKDAYTNVSFLRSEIESGELPADKIFDEFVLASIEDVVTYSDYIIALLDKTIEHDPAASLSDDFEEILRLRSG